MYQCTHCNSSFSRQNNLRRHIRVQHTQDQNRFLCSLCNNVFADYRDLRAHHNNEHRPTNNFEQQAHALNHSVDMYRKIFTVESTKSIADAFNSLTLKEIKQVLLYELELKSALKYNITISIQLVMVSSEQEIVSEISFPIRSKARMLLHGDHSEIQTQIAGIRNELEANLERMNERGSNWVVDYVTSLDIQTATISPIRVGGIYTNNSLSFKKLTRKNELLNINSKKRCLLYCTAAFFLLKNNCKAKVTKYTCAKFFRFFNVKNVAFPITLNDMERFSKQNEHLSFNYNVFFLDEKQNVYPYKLQHGLSNAKSSINLLLTDIKVHVNERRYHFVLVKDINKFLTNSYHGNKRMYYAHPRFFCFTCLNHFANNSMLQEHKRFCLATNGTVERAPPGSVQEKYITFNNHSNKFKKRFIAYADFETVLAPVSDRCKVCSNLRCKCDNSFTNSVNLQEPICYSFYIIENGKSILYSSNYFGENAGEHFVRMLLEIEDKIIDLFNKNAPMKELTASQIDAYNSCSNCHICEKPISDYSIKVRDHDHYTGEYIGAAHSTCNVLRHHQKKLPIYFHNGSKYDYHLIIPHLHINGIRNISVLARNSEVFRSVDFNCYSIMDSMAHLSASLSELGQILLKSGHNYPVLKQSKFGVNEKTLNFCLTKSFFPYEYCTSLKDFYTCTVLPPKKAFYSSLTEEEISDENYAFAQSVWKYFNFKNLAEYTLFYCELDTLLLAEIFEQNRQNVFNFCQLDNSYYLGIPGLAYDAMLKITDISIEKLTDIDQIYFIENGIRGGLSYVNTRYIESTTSSAETDIAVAAAAAAQKQWHILYIDANNLYGSAQYYPMPVSNFTWCDQSEINEFNVMSIGNLSMTGYILEVDLEYPEHLHRLHDAYPLAPETTFIEYANLSPYAQKIHKQFANNTLFKAKRLMSTLNNKLNYVVHYRNLQLYVSLGMKIKKVHRILKFEQQAFLQKYIGLCTEKRVAAKSDFEKKMYKLFANSVFGKFCENKRDYTNIELITNQKMLAKRVASPFYKNVKIINKHLTAVIMRQKSITLDKAYPIGFSILELSKYFMYDTWYNVIQPYFGLNNIIFGLTDTDSWIFSVRTNDINNDLRQLAEFFDFSNYDVNHELYSDEHKNALFYYKDEMKGNKITHFCGLRSKCYSFKFKDEKKTEIEKNVCKGVKRVAIRNRLTFDQYKNCIISPQIIRHSFENIHVRNHVIKTAHCKKVALNSFDCKRFIFNCAIHSMSYGNKEINIDGTCPICG